MKYALFLLASLAYGQSELGTSAIRIMPRAADSDTGSVRFVELYSNGSNRIDLRAPQSIHANKILRVPNDNGTLVADFNSVYGSDTFTITSLVAAGTEASPSDISNGRDLFKFAGYARTGGSSVQAARLLFTAETASPLQTFATVGLTNSGTFKANSYAFEYSKFWPAEGQRPDLGTSAASGRWATLYGDSADFLVPTGSAPAYETGSFVRTQTVDIYDIGGQSGGWSLTAENETVGDSFLRITDATASDALRIYRKIANAATNHVRSYMDIFPNVADTYNLGSDVLPWDNLWAHDANVVNLSLEGNSTYRTYFVSGSSLAADVVLTWPSANVSGVLTNDGSGGLSWGAGGGSGSAPLGEVNLMDYGADNTCTTAITAGSPSPWEQAYDVAKLTGGYITLPAGGCYGIDDTLANGNSAGTSESTDLAITIKGAGAAYNPSGLAPATEIRWIGSAPGSPTPMVEFRGPINAGGIEGVLLNANNTANVYYVRQRHHGYGTFRNVWAKRSPVSPSWIVTTSSSSYPYGACYNRYDQLHITNDGVAGGGGIYLTGTTNVDACSNLFTDGEVWYDGDTAGTYGIKLDYADNNTFLRFNFNRYSPGPSTLEGSGAYNSGSSWAVSCNTSTEYCTLGASNANITNGARVRFSYNVAGSLPTGIQWALPYFVINKSGNTFQVSLTSGGSAVDITAAGSSVIVYLITPGVLLERYSGDTSFPKENAWYSSAIHNGVWSPNPPTGGNDFPEFQPDDCYVSPCIPDLDYVWGKAKGQMLGSGATPPGVEVRHSDSQNTFRVNQASGIYNGAGSIAFQRNATTLGRIRVGYFDGMVFSTASSGTMAERWKITDAGHWYPASDATYSIGNVSNRPDQIWARGFRSYTNNAFGAQSHILYADHNVNFELTSYGSTGADYRGALLLSRSRGSAGSVTPVEANDRLGTVAWRGNTASGTESQQTAARIDAYVTSRSGSTLETEMRFATMNSSASLDTRWKITGAGHLLPNSISQTIGEASGFSPAHVYTDNVQIKGGSGAVYPAGDGFGYVGISAAHFYYGYIDNLVGRSSVTLQNGGSAIFQVSPTSLALVDSSGTLLLGANSTWTTVNNAYFTGVIQAPSGISGFNGTLTCGSGQAVKTITASYGILTSATCGAP